MHHRRRRGGGSGAHLQIFLTPCHPPTNNFNVLLSHVILSGWSASCDLSNSLHHRKHSSVPYSDLSSIVASFSVQIPDSTKERVLGYLFLNRCEQYWKLMAIPSSNPDRSRSRSRSRRCRCRCRCSMQRGWLAVPAVQTRWPTRCMQV